VKPEPKIDWSKKRYALLPVAPTNRKKRGVLAVDATLAESVEFYGGLLVHHLKAKGYAIAGPAGRMFFKQIQNPETEVAAHHAQLALLEFAAGSAAAAKGESDRAAASALRGGVLAGRALVLFQNDITGTGGRKTRSANDAAKQAEIVEACRALYNKWSSSARPSQKQIHGKLCELRAQKKTPPLKTVQRYLHAADYANWPWQERKSKYLPQ